MNIIKHYNNKDSSSYISVINSEISRSYLYKVISRFPGVVIEKKPKFWDDDIFCKFRCKELYFYIEEPYGDSDTFDIVSNSQDLAVLSELAAYLEKIPPKKQGDLLYNILFFIRQLAFTALILIIGSYILSYFF